MKISFSWKHLPVPVAGVILLFLYAGRTILFGGLITGIVEARIEAVSENTMDIRIERLGGSWFTGIALEGISTADPAERGPLRSLSADRLALRYNPFAFLSPKPLDAIRSVTARNLRVHIAPVAAAGRNPEGQGAGPAAEPVLPGRIISGLLETLPDRMRIDADAEVTLETGSSEPMRFRGKLDGTLRDELRLVTELPSNGSLAGLDRDQRVGIALRTEDRTLRIRSLSEETSMPLDLEGRIEVSAEEPAVISAIDISFEAGPLSGRISATPEQAEASLTVEPERANGIPVIFLSDATLRYGTLDAEAEARFGPEAPREVLDLLLVRPREVLPYLNASLDADFAAWAFEDLAMDRGGAEVSWDGSLLTVRRLEIDAGRTGSAKIAGMVLDPDAPFPIASLERADVRLQDLGGVIGAFTDADAEYAAPVDRVVLSASSDGRGVLTVSSLEIRGGPAGTGENAAFFRASGVVDVTVPSVRRSEFSFRIPALDVLPIPAAQQADGTDIGGSFAGEGSFSGSLAPEDLFAILNGATGRLDLNGNDLRIGTLSLPTARVSASLSNGTILLEQAEAVLPNGRVDVRARLAARQGLLRGTVEQARLSFVEDGEEYLVALRRPASFALSDGSITIDPVQAAFLGGELSVKGTLSGDSIAGSASLSGVRIGRLLRLAGADLPMTGSISAELTAEGPLAMPRIAMAIRGTGFSIRGTDGTLRLEVRQDDRSLVLDHLEANFGDLLRLTGDGRLPFGIGAKGLRYFSLRESRFAIKGTLGSLAAWFPEDAGQYLPDGEVAVDASVVEDSGELGVSMLLSNRDDPDQLGVESSLGYRALSVGVRLKEEEGDRIGTGLTIRADGQPVAEISGSITIPGLSRAEPQFDPDRVNISGEVTLNLPLEYLTGFVPQVVHMSGLVTGTIRTDGTLARPAARGQLKISSAEVRMEADIPSISSLNGVILLDGRNVTVRELRGELGYAPFTVTVRARLPAEGDHGSVEARLSGDNILLVTNPDLRARADADITARGTFAAMRISGTVEVTDALFTRNVPLISLNATPSVDPESFQLFSVRGETGSSTELDILVRADRTIRIQNNLYSGKLSMDLNIGGTLQVPIPTGRIFGDQGELMLPLTTIRLRQILVRFPQEDPFSPIVQIRGVAQIRGYELVLNVSGSLPDVEVEVTSTPPLRQEQALVLLTTGYTPQELTESGSRTVRTLGGYIGKQLFSALTGGGDAESESLFDRVDIVIGKDISESGQETVEIEFRLGEGDSWYLVFQRDRYDRFNLDLAWRFWFE